MCDDHQKPITASDTPAFFGIDRYGFPEAGEHPLDPAEYYPPYFWSERFQKLGYHVEELRGGFYWVTSGGYDAAFVVTDEGVIAIDAPPTLGENMLAAIEDVTDKPVTHVIYSHWHTDHIGAASVYGPDVGRLKEIVEYSDDLPPDIEEGIAGLRQALSPPATVAVLKEGGRILVDTFWEFVPYNDPRPKPQRYGVFASQVDKVRGALMAARTRAYRQASLAQLKTIYDRHLKGPKKVAIRRNRGSLFLFEGPTQPYRSAAWSHGWNAFSPFHAHQLRWQGSGFRSKGRFLMTGDGYLNATRPINWLTQFFGPDRLRDVLALQVMHHGAKANSHPGLAGQLSPAFSVFSADPIWTQPGHPHGEVVRDFLPYAPLLADANSGVAIVAHYRHLASSGDSTVV